MRFQILKKINGLKHFRGALKLGQASVDSCLADRRFFKLIMSKLDKDIVKMISEMLVGRFELSPQRRPIWVWHKFYLSPKKYHFKTYSVFIILSGATLNYTLTAKNSDCLPPLQVE